MELRNALFGLYRNQRRRRGAALGAIQDVLSKAPAGMRQCDIHSAVEQIFGASVPISTIKYVLSTQVAHGALERPKPGWYQAKERPAS